MNLELKLEALIKVTYRSKSQTEHLLTLCGNDFNQLLYLEQKIKENCLGYTPGGQGSVDVILSMKPIRNPWRSVYKEYMFELLKLKKENGI
jgi:hypothetical protein